MKFVMEGYYWKPILPVLSSELH
uniref:Coatomer subunit zeta-1 n=1 Tax=Triatoma infestans TaxID=30076 RepID=A0A171APN6_TRIIF